MGCVAPTPHTTVCVYYACGRVPATTERESGAVSCERAGALGPTGACGGAQVEAFVLFVAEMCAPSRLMQWPSFQRSSPHVRRAADRARH